MPDSGIASSASRSSRARLTELIRVAIRSARAQGEGITENELIDILEDMDRKALLSSDANILMHSK